MKELTLSGRFKCDFGNNQTCKATQIYFNTFTRFNGFYNVDQITLRITTEKSKRFIDKKLKILDECYKTGFSPSKGDFVFENIKIYDEKHIPILDLKNAGIVCKEEGNMIQYVFDCDWWECLLDPHSPHWHALDENLNNFD